MNIRTGIRMALAPLALAALTPLAAQNDTTPTPAVEASPAVPATPAVAPAPVPEVPAPVTPAPAPAPKPVVKPAPVKKGAPDSLRPGQFVFEKHDNYNGAMRIVAVLDIQRLYVFLDDKLIAFSTISSGKKGHSTPTGRFTILEKDIDHKSNIYSNAPMPYMQRLTWDGIALHAGHNPGFPASHGCIRLPLAFSKLLYSVTKMGQEVVVLPNLGAPTPPKVQPPATPPATPPVTPPVDNATPPPAPPATNPTPARP